MLTEPMSAALILLLEPPEAGIPPNTIAMITSIPTLDAVDVVIVGAFTTVRKAESPTPIPAIAKAIMDNFFTEIPVSLAQTGLPPTNFSLRPNGV